MNRGLLCVATFSLGVLAPAVLAQQGPPPRTTPGGQVATDLECTGCVGSNDIQDGAVNLDKLAQDVHDGLSGILTDLDLLDDLLGLSEKTVFVTSTAYTGNLGGLAGADFICQQHADGAGLAGRFKAWLSDSSWSPSNRFVQSIVPYVLAGAFGSVVRDNYKSLGFLAHAINVDETGVGLNVPVWTGTHPGGVAHDDHCEDWTNDHDLLEGSMGFSYATNFFWTTHNRASCNLRLHLYCFEQ